MKPGWKTTEFWLTLLTALPSVGVTAGLIPSADKTMLDSAASKIAAGLLAAITVAKYIHGRALVKSNTPLLVIVTTLLMPGLLWAQQPSAQPTCLLPWRAQVERRLQLLEQQRPAPQPDYQGLGGTLKQDIPLGPLPKQEIPLGETPKQQIPLEQKPAEPPLKPMPPTGPVSYQRYTWMPALAR